MLVDENTLAELESLSTYSVWKYWDYRELKLQEKVREFEEYSRTLSSGKMPKQEYDNLVADLFLLAGINLIDSSKVVTERLKIMEREADQMEIYARESCGSANN